ncbi:MAG: hypothetical protein ACR2KK_05725 [Acidimicrobiales bacterium]
MAMPPSARGRKKRLVRVGETPHDLLLVIRATPADREAVIEMVEDAELSARQYVVEAATGTLEVLYGVSVFARRSGVEVASVVDRFTGAPSYIEVAVGTLRAAGFAVYPTGTNVEHFDIQLIGRVQVDDSAASNSDLEDAAACLLNVGGPLRPNPAYAGGTAASRQEDR